MNLLRQCFPEELKTWNDLRFIPDVWHFFIKDDIVVAYLSITTESSFRLSGKRIYILHNVCTHKDFRRQKLMKQLIQYTIRNIIIPSSDEPYFGLYVDAANDAAISLYKSLGFEFIDHHDTHGRRLMIRPIQSVFLTFDYNPTMRTKRQKIQDLINPKRMMDCVANAFEVVGLITTQHQRGRIGYETIMQEIALALLRKKTKKIIHTHTIGGILEIKNFIMSNLPVNRLMLLVIGRSNDMSHMTVVGNIRGEFYMIDYQLGNKVIRGMDDIMDVFHKEETEWNHNTFYTYTINHGEDVAMKSTPQIIKEKQRPLLLMET